MEKVDCIHDLLRRGRSKGASVLLGMQGIEAVNEVYGENAAEDMLSQCAYKTFLRVGGPKTAEWAERYFNKVRKTESVWSESWNRDGHSVSVQYNVTERSLFLASVFLNLPFPVPGGPLIAISDVPCLGCSLISRRWFDQLLASLKPPVGIAEVIPRDGLVEQTLQDWETAEERFHCGPPPPKKRKTKRTKKPRQKKPRGRARLPDPKKRKRVPPAS